VTTDNSLPDVYAYEAAEKDDAMWAHPILTFRRMAVSDRYVETRYTPAAPAEATIKSLRDALRAHAIDKTSWCRICEQSVYTSPHAPDCLLAKDAP